MGTKVTGNKTQNYCLGQHWTIHLYGTTISKWLPLVTSKAVIILENACRKKSYAWQMVPAFCRSAVIHALAFGKKTLSSWLCFNCRIGPSVCRFAAGVKVIELSGKRFSDRAFFSCCEKQSYACVRASSGRAFSSMFTVLEYTML